ncbi:phospho-N-acetylmuramoyl-pentapeptide-transferase [bacterium CG_4_10_14_0_8_um_filter_33_57]|nr:MAG: phospho-N-acetylmuramoyl-pentapeptide-transferase [bacterium CG_4_10_14_0_8_um_filter_33_57]
MEMFYLSKVYFFLLMPKIFLMTAVSFCVALLFTPIITHFLYKYNIRQQIREEAVDGKKSSVFYSLHERKKNTPTMGGIIIWVSVLLVTVLFNLSRSQTWLPLFVLVSAGILGVFDDLFNVLSIGAQKGIRALRKLALQILIASIGAWWFFYKLGFHSIHIPGVGDFNIGWLYIILFIFVMVASMNSVNITDGLDGLAAGLLAIAFGAFAIIAFAKGKLELAAFCGSILGALLAFLWFNVYPARFFMGDTGSMALGATLGVVALLLNSVLVLPIIGFVFVIETLSSIIQLFSKKFFKKKIFISAPLHHHLEAKGWPEPKITMRLWIISAVMGSIGLVVGLIGMGVR